MKLRLASYRWNSQGELVGTVTLEDNAGNPLYQDWLSLSRQASRRRFAATLQKLFPELKGRDIEGQLLNLLWEAGGPEKVQEPPQGRDSQASRLVRLIEDQGVTLFQNPTRGAFARIHATGHLEVWPCRSKAFKQWLAREFWQAEGKTPNSDALNSALNVIEGKALFEGGQFQLHNRVAWHQGSLWYDLADENWRAVEITPEGWRIVRDPPILFQRYAHQKPQVEPVRGGDPWRLVDFVNVRDELEQLLLLVYLCTCFIPDIPHPIPHPHGEKGSAKTTLFKVFRSLVDPSVEEVLTFPRDISELQQKLSHHWLAYFDNLSSIPDWISDALSRAVTGAGFSKRELYSDDEDVIYAFQRCVGLNGINVVATKSDLLDRVLLFNLQLIPPDRRKKEADLLAEFEAEKPGIFGGILDVLCEAVRIYPTLALEAVPRMADFAHWGCAIARALGTTDRDFLGAYWVNIEGQSLEVVTSSPVASTLLDLMEDRETWQGTPAELLEELEARAERLKVKIKVKSWPGAPHILTRKLNELRGNLREMGILIDDLPRTGQQGRRLKITKADLNSTKNSVTSVATDIKSAPVGDATGPRPSVTSPQSLSEEGKGHVRGDASVAKISTLEGRDGGKPDHPCFACGSTNWRQRPDGGWVCGVCHPRPEVEEVERSHRDPWDEFLIENEGVTNDGPT